jgi:hypothetical protein
MNCTTCDTLLGEYKFWVSRFKDAVLNIPGALVAHACKDAYLKAWLIRHATDFIADHPRRMPLWMYWRKFPAASEAATNSEPNVEVIGPANLSFIQPLPVYSFRSE